MKISAILIFNNDSDRDLLKKCLESISWVDEIVKVDTQNLSGGFAGWRNLGAKKAKGDWLFYIDFDESVTHDLKEEILKVTSQNSYSAYAIPRRNIIFGKEMKYCGLWPDYVLRLINKEKLIGWFGELHEQPKINGETSHLKSHLIHTKHKELSEMVEKTNKWSEIEAKLMFEANHPKMNLWRFFTAGFREFWKRMIIQLAFLDGTEGVIYGLYQVYSRLISYTKLWEMQLNNNLKK